MTLSFVNSRMKDFYDIYSLIKSRDFKGIILAEAIAVTLKRRKTVLKEFPDVFQDHFYSQPDKLNQWKAFNKKLHSPSVDFIIICNHLKEIGPPACR